MIRTRGLTKRFGRITAVDALDLEVREGDIYGFLGPNGSGKTTVVRMLLGLVFATAGEIELLGVSVPSRVRDVLPDVGALVEGPAGIALQAASERPDDLRELDRRREVDPQWYQRA
ncbi:ATP-binding cassette domain-containing protein, partial [Sporichthya sp.]|uniref:ATP-binding cassette domain-containing protein n=1 Tax=Sporichthya sp. TaxID=65475 RepID=UPI0017BBA040|nr:ATP-binding cassette domain-containing protein [Sporichthya sp.]